MRAPSRPTAHVSEPPLPNPEKLERCFATGGIDRTHAASRCFPTASLSASATISSSSNCRSRMSASFLRAAARLMNALPSYDEWSAWTVAVHNERGSLLETVPFPTHGHGSLCPEEGTDRWPQPSPANLHPTGSTRYH